MSDERRVLLSNTRWWMFILGILATRTLIYDRGDCLEVEERDHFTIIRRRIYFNDVAMVSFHRYHNKSVVVMLFVFALLFFLPAIALFMDRHAWPAGIILACATTLPMVLFAVFHIVVGASCLRIHGMRASAELRFRAGHMHALGIYHKIGEHIRAQQEALRGEPAASPPPSIEA